MPSKRGNPQPYFTITRAARMLGVSASSLRNWERLGLIKPARSQGRYRLYSRDVLDTAKRIQYLRRQKRLNIAGVAHLLKEHPAPGTVTPPLRNAQEGIGSRLVRLRRNRGLTLAAVAEQTGLSASFLSAVERGEANPSIGTLQKLAVLYGTNVRSFFGEHRTGKRLVRPRERETLQPQPGVRMEELAVGDTIMDPAIFRIAPGASSGGSYHHEGEEFIYVLQGRLEVWLDELERYVLAPGDCLYFSSTQSHRWLSLSDRETRVIWVNTPPTF